MAKQTIASYIANQCLNFFRFQFGECWTRSLIQLFIRIIIFLPFPSSFFFLFLFNDFFLLIIIFLPFLPFFLLLFDLLFFFLFDFFLIFLFHLFRRLLWSSLFSVWRQTTRKRTSTCNASHTQGSIKHATHTQGSVKHATHTQGRAKHATHTQGSVKHATHTTRQCQTCNTHTRQCQTCNTTIHKQFKFDIIMEARKCNNSNKNKYGMHVANEPLRCCHQIALFACTLIDHFFIDLLCDLSLFSIYFEQSFISSEAVLVSMPRPGTVSPWNCALFTLHQIPCAVCTLGFVQGVFRYFTNRFTRRWRRIGTRTVRFLKWSDAFKCFLLGLKRWERTSKAIFIIWNDQTKVNGDEWLNTKTIWLTVAQFQLCGLHHRLSVFLAFRLVGIGTNGCDMCAISHPRLLRSMQNVFGYKLSKSAQARSDIFSVEEFTFFCV